MQFDDVTKLIYLNEKSTGVISSRHGLTVSVGLSASHKPTAASTSVIRKSKVFSLPTMIVCPPQSICMLH